MLVNTKKVFAKTAALLLVLSAVSCSYHDHYRDRDNNSGKDSDHKEYKQTKKKAKDVKDRAGDAAHQVKDGFEDAGDAISRQ